MGHVVFNRVVIGTTTVRFFFKRADAINQANAYTRLSQQQHNVDGRLPKGLDVGSLRH